MLASINRRGKGGKGCNASEARLIPQWQLLQGADTMTPTTRWYSCCKCKGNTKGRGGKGRTDRGERKMQLEGGGGLQGSGTVAADVRTVGDSRPQILGRLKERLQNLHR